MLLALDTCVARNAFPLLMKAWGSEEICRLPFLLYSIRLGREESNSADKCVANHEVERLSAAVESSGLR